MPEPIWTPERQAEIDKEHRRARLTSTETTNFLCENEWVFMSDRSPELLASQIHGLKLIVLDLIDEWKERQSK